MTAITNSRILILATNGFEQSELMVPLDSLREKGATVEVATLDGKPIKGWKDGNWGETVPANLSVDDVTVANYDALVLPGGQINPDILRSTSRAKWLTAFTSRKRKPGIPMIRLSAK
jgi:protease I